ncbi:MAG: succinylglutamate desuccinylase/aspartoacylase family protein [Clostridia bacterium]
MKQLKIDVQDFLKTELEVFEFGSGSPEVLITGGIHGGEATGIYVAQKVIKYLNENDLLKGKVTIMPICNPTAFRRKERTSPYDNLDMNRIFPGDKDGSITQRTANEIWNIAKDKEYLIDLHCCGNWGYSYTLALWQDNEEILDFSRMLDIPILVQSSGADGQLFVELTKLGKKALIIELPGGGSIAEVELDAANNAYKAILNFFGQMGLIEFNSYTPDPKKCDKLIPLRAAEEGLFLTKHIAGDVIELDQLIAHINGTEIIAQKTGTLTSLRPPGFVFKGDYLGALAPHKTVK